MSARVAAWAVWTLCGLTIMLVCCVLTFDVYYRRAFPPQDQGLLLLLGVVASAFVGALVASRLPATRQAGSFWSVRSVSRWARPLPTTPSTGSSIC